MPAGINSISIPDQYRLEAPNINNPYALLPEGNNKQIAQAGMELFQLAEVRPFLNVPRSNQPEIDPNSAVILDVETRKRDEVEEVMNRANNTATLMINALDSFNQTNEGPIKKDLIYQVPPSTGRWRRAEVVEIGKSKNDRSRSIFKIVIYELETSKETDPRKRRNNREEAIEIVCEGVVPDEQQVIGRGNYQVTGMYLREKGKNRRVTQAAEAEILLNQRCIKPVTAERNNRRTTHENTVPPTEQQRIAELIQLEPRGFNPTAYGQLGGLINQIELEILMLEENFRNPQTSMPGPEMQALRIKIAERKQRLNMYLAKQKEVRRANNMPENQQVKAAEEKAQAAEQAKAQAEAKLKATEQEKAQAVQAQKDTEAKLASALQLQKATEQAKAQLETTLKTTQEQLKQSAQLLVEMKQALDSAQRLLAERQAELAAYEKYAQAVELGRKNNLMERAETAADQILEMLVQAGQIKPGENPSISIGSIDTLQEYIKDNSTDKGFHENNIHLVSDTLELVALQMNNPKLFLEQLAKRQRATQPSANAQQQAQLAKYVSMIQNQMSPNNEDTRNIVDPYLIEEFIYTCNQAQMNEPIKKNSEAQNRRERVRKDKQARKDRNQQYRDQQRAQHRGPQSNQKPSTNSIT